jgi:uncharacterized protein (DUF1697 family)
VTKYVAFLRGINVGGRVVRMADLQACFRGLGLREVRTVLQTGNVAFESSDNAESLKRKIEAGLAAAFHYPAKAQVYKVDDLRRIVDAYPFGTAGAGQHDYVIFLENGLERSLVDETYELAAGEQVTAGEGVVYWRVNKGSTLKTSFAKLLIKARYKDFNTNRNLKTLHKLLG